jgi:hypothetical protein
MSTTPPLARSKGRSILLVSTLEHEVPALRQIVGGDDRVRVVVPVVKQGFLDWLANDERAFSHAEDVAAQTAEELPTEAADSAAGEADVALAIRDALATFAADEVVVAVGPDDRELLTERLDPEDGVPPNIDGIPLRLVVVRGG